MIGGTDVVFWVRDGLQLEAADLILRTVRRHWPALTFQNANEETATPLPNTDGYLPKPTGREFFIYRDRQAALSWDEHGAIPENRNAMLHVLLGKRGQPDSDMKSLTLVCDELTPDMRSLIDEVKTGIDDLNY